MPTDVMYGSPAPLTGGSQSPSEYASSLRKQLEGEYSRVRDKTGHQQKRQKVFYDTKVHGAPYEPGDLVFLHSPAVPRGQAKKLLRPWLGPFRIVRRLSESTYGIQHLMSSRHRLVVHFDWLKLCPPGMRHPVATPNPRHSSEPSTDTPPPPGINLQLVPEEDHPQRPPPRYPRRIRTVPDYYAPGIGH